MRMTTWLSLVIGAAGIAALLWYMVATPGRSWSGPLPPLSEDDRALRDRLQAHAPAWIPGVDWSDQAAFWAADFHALMVTDTAPYRYPHYHTKRDTPDQVDYERLARVVRGLEQAFRALDVSL